MPFQSTVNRDPAPAVEGDFASANPRSSMLAGPGELVSGPLGVTIGQFARAANATGIVTTAHPGVASRLGFVHRDQVSIITPFLGEATMLTAAGSPITLFDAGDFWDRFAVAPTVGQKVFANYATGAAVGGTAGTAPDGTTFSATTTNGSANLTAVGAGAFAGAPISGTGIPANTYLVSVNTTAGTAVMSANATASGTVTVTPKAAQETNYYVHKAYGSGELSKISTRMIVA